MNKPNLNTQSVLSMKGEGYYSQKTVGAKNAIDKMEVLIEEAFKNIPKVDKNKGQSTHPVASSV